MNVTFEYLGTYDAWCAGLFWTVGSSQSVSDEASIAELDTSPLHKRTSAPQLLTPAITPEPIAEPETPTTN